MTVTIMDVTALDPSRFHYTCAADHCVTNSPAPLEACPAYVRGVACSAELTAFGPGSRKRASS